MPSAFLALDWGTTNLRAWRVGADGRVEDHREFPLGVGKLAPGEPARRFFDTVRPQMGADLPAIACGMIGSTLGWVEVPYLDCPVELAGLKAGLHWVDAPGQPVWIVPGLRCERPGGGPDVMRGEETHVLGWAAAQPERCNGERLICHPGTHPKWVRLVDGRIEAFITAMSGELFDVLARHSVLKSAEAPDDDDAFDAGLKAAGDGGALASRLFTTRSKVVGGDMTPEAARSYLSGLLIGAEAAGVPPLFGVERGAHVSVIGDLRLCGLYRRGLEARGFTVEVHDGEDAALAGMRALMEGIRP